MGLMFAWSLVPSASSGDAPGYALLNNDLTATPAFLALSALGTGTDGSLAGTGFVPMESRPISYDGTWSDQHLNDLIFKTTGETNASATLRFRGTGVEAYLRESRQAGLLKVTLDGGPLPGWPSDGHASVIDLSFYQAENVWVTLASGLADAPHELRLTLGGPGQLTIGGVVIARDAPLVWPVALLAPTSLALLIIALRDVAYFAAARAGYLQRRRGVELRPPLPNLPDWRPARRT
jgi:hypothetical protein